MIYVSVPYPRGKIAVTYKHLFMLYHFQSETFTTLLTPWTEHLECDPSGDREKAHSWWSNKFLINSNKILEFVTKFNTTLQIWFVR